MPNAFLDKFSAVQSLCRDRAATDLTTLVIHRPTIAHLLKWVHFEQDAHGRDLELRYFRDTDGREVDFVAVDGRTPVLFVECKLGDQAPDKGLRYLKVRFPDCPAWQVSATGKKDYLTPEGIRVAPALALLRDLV